jgi:hypothetical protein
MLRLPPGASCITKTSLSAMQTFDSMMQPVQTMRKQTGMSKHLSVSSCGFPHDQHTRRGFSGQYGFEYYVYQDAVQVVSMSIQSCFLGPNIISGLSTAAPSDMVDTSASRQLSVLAAEWLQWFSLEQRRTSATAKTPNVPCTAGSNDRTPPLSGHGFSSPFFAPSPCLLPNASRAIRSQPELRLEIPSAKRRFSQSQPAPQQPSQPV